jgi:methyl-accepting chemotaxis protein
MRMTIAKKLYAAFGAVVLIMLVMVGVSLRAGTRAETGAARLSEMMTDSDVAGDAFQSTLLMRLSFGDFLLTNEAASFTSYEKSHRDAQTGLATSRAAFADPERLAAVGNAEKALAAFSDAAEELHGIVTERNRLIADRLNVIGPRLVDRVRENQDAKLEAANIDQLAPAIALADSVMLMRLTAAQYLRSYSETDLERVLTASDEAFATLRTMKAAESDSAALGVLNGIETELGTYTETFRSIGDLVRKRNSIVADRISPAAEQIAAARVTISDSLVADGSAVRDEVNGDLAASRVQTITAACIAIAVAVALAFVVSRGISGPIRVFLERFDLIARGDFTQRVVCKTKDEIGELANGFNALIEQIAGLISSVQDTANQVSAAATEVAATSEQMASSSDHQRSQLTQVAAAIEEMAATITEVSGRAGEVSRQSTEAGGQATEGGEIVRQTVDEMGLIAGQVESTSAAVSQLSEKAVQIGEILTVINDIADQTNLLALNAAIEAARAGEHGRGFAVVADEVRKLAERTQEATQEVSRSIGEIQTSTGDATQMMAASRDRVNSGVTLARQAGDSLENIVKGSTTVAQSIDSIASAVEEQSATTTELARSVEVISASADEATQGANQAAAAATQLSGNAETLRELVARFKV